MRGAGGAGARIPMPAKREVLVFDDAGALFDAAAREVVRIAVDACKRRDFFTVVLAGGSTPRGLYERLAEKPYRRDIDWKSVDVYFGDERCVPPDDAASNFRMADEALLSRVPLPRRAIYRIRGELRPDLAAALYESTLRAAGAFGPMRWDLVLLGIGSDGHTASLFPGSPALRERRRLVVPTIGPTQPYARITLTLRALNLGRTVMFLAAGKEKAGAVRKVMAEAERARGASRAVLPAALVRPGRGRFLWFLDRAAASRLGKDRA